MKTPCLGMRRLSGKLIAGVVLILLLTLAGTLFVNSRLIEKLYLHEQCVYVGEIGEHLKGELERGSSPQEAVRAIEEQEKALVVYAKEARGPEEMAGVLRESFRQKGLGFQKFWMWEEDYRTVLEKGMQFRLYGQEKLNYSILVEYLSLPSGLYAVAVIVPDGQRVLSLVNRSGFLIDSAAILTAIGLIAAFTRHITRPLAQIRLFAKKVAIHDYQPLAVRTGDELEEVADSLNEMAREIERYQTELEEKNRQMKQLLSDVAHELKTPVSLVGMYAGGIKDGLDDGTFLDTILRQNDRMSQTVEKLLRLSRIERGEQPCERLLLDQILVRCIEEQAILFGRRNLTLKRDIQAGLGLTGSRELLEELFSNLLSNAAKYAAPGVVRVELKRRGQGYWFQMVNSTENTDLDTERIWEPFYVGESSRSQGLSGTGLGLPIVKKIADRFHYSLSCRLDGREISFAVFFRE